MEILPNGMVIISSVSDLKLNVHLCIPPFLKTTAELLPVYVDLYIVVMALLPKGPHI